MLELILYITFGVSLFILLILIYSTYKDDFESIWHRLSNYFGYFISIAFVAFVVVTIIFGLIRSRYESNFKNIKEVPYKEYELVSLNDNRDIHGGAGMIFFVGSGYINQELYYYFYVKDIKTGLIEFKKEYAENNYYDKIYIKEIDGNEKPRFVKYGYFLKDKESIFYDPYLIENSKSILYVPKGSVLKNFNLDLK
ncbi:MAG: hypothetical protein ACOC33_02815 [bacterium]